MGMAEPVIRDARRCDAADLAILDNLAGHGISMWFWQRETPSGLVEDAMAFGRSRFSNPDAVFGYANSLVAEQDSMIVGSVCCYVMPQPDDEADYIKREAPAFRPLFELFEKAQGHWFVDSLAVYPEARGTGVGKRLLSRCLELGEASGVDTTTLIVEDGNKPACELYRKQGFQVRESKPYIEFRGKSASRHWLMLSRPL
jgi:ribosomal protein S18 acetylase RimI-like enzyme